MAMDSHFTASKPLQDFLLAIQQIWDYLFLQTFSYKQIVNTTLDHMNLSQFSSSVRCQRSH